MHPEYSLSPGRFATGCGFAGEKRFVAGQMHRLQRRPVGGQTVALGEQQHIARNDAARADLADSAVAPDARRGRGELPQRLQRFFRAVFLQKAHRRVHENDDDDGNGLCSLSHHHGDERRRRKDQDHDILELREEHRRHALRRLSPQPVFADLRQPVRGFGAGKSLLRIIHVRLSLRFFSSLCKIRKKYHRICNQIVF